LPRDIAGAVALRGVLAIARLRELTRGRPRRREPSGRKLAAGEVIVAFPEQAWRGERSTAAAAVVELIVRRMSRWDVTAGTRPLSGLSRRYLLISTAAGAEDDVVRALKVAAWRFGLPRGRLGMLVVRSPLLLPAALITPPGSIEFTSHYDAAKAIVGAINVDARDVTILVIDVDRPDTRFLDAEVIERLEVLEASGHEITDGHATLMTAIVGDIARGAKIKTLSIGDERGAGLWSLLEVLLGDLETDLIVASLSAPEGKRPRDERARETVFDSLLRSRENQPSRPPLLFPTGNHDLNDRGPEIDTIAIPARFPSVIAIGALDTKQGRAAGSRYGRKRGADPSAWWLAPGGSFGSDAPEEPLATMGGVTQVGTSIANAIAGGVAAAAIHNLRADPSPRDPLLNDALDELERRLQDTPGAEQSLVLAKAIRSRHTGAITHTLLVSEFERLARRVTKHVPLEHGQGVLCLD
jgi:hypothetical protein